MMVLAVASALFKSYHYCRATHDNFTKLSCRDRPAALVYDGHLHRCHREAYRADQLAVTCTHGRPKQLSEMAEIVIGLSPWP